MRLLENK